MPFKKGQSGNPGGKVKSNYRRMLEVALAADTKTHRQSLLKFAVAKARTDSTVLNAILKKMLPDLKSIEAKIDSDSPFRLILEYKPTVASSSKGDKAGKQSIDSCKCPNPDGHSPKLCIDDKGKKEYRCEWCGCLIINGKLSLPAGKAVKVKVKTLRQMADERRTTAKTDGRSTEGTTDKEHS